MCNKSLDLRILTGSLLLVLTLILPIITLGTGEEQFIREWEYTLPSEISALTVSDINGDGYDEIIVASSNDLYIFNKEGRIESKYQLDANGTISVLYPADLYNDGRNEILIGINWMETKEVTAEHFALTDNMLEEKEKVLYKTIRNKGSIYILNEDVSKWITSLEWIRSIHVADLNSSGNKEVIVASGGVNIDFFELISRTEEGNISRNRTEESVWNGSVSIFNKDKELLGNYQMDGVAWFVYSSDLYGDGSKEILSCSRGRLYVFDNELNILWTYESPDTVKQIYSGHLTDSDIRGIILSFDGITVDGIQLISNKGNEIWTYRLPPRKNIIAIYVTDIDLDGNKEILIASNNEIYGVSKDGKLEWKYLVKDKINKICFTDSDLIIASGTKISVYKVSAEFIKKQKGDNYLLESQRYLDGGNYEDAKKYIELAINLYQSINYSKGISKCNSLMVKIKNGLNRNKKIMADSVYSKALSYYALSHYENAMEYAENASRIYTEINDTTGMEKCDVLIRKINKAMGVVVTTTTTTTTTSIQIVTTTPVTTIIYIPPYTRQQRGLSSKDFILLMSGLLISLVLSLKMRQIAKIRTSKEKPEEAKEPKLSDLNSDLKELENNL